MIPTTQIPSTCWPKKFDQFRDLIYVPLDLPEPPKVDLELFIDWALTKAPAIVNAVKDPLSGQKILHFEEKGLKGWGYYPWVQVSAFHHGFSDQYIADFDKLFPDVVDYINLFPQNILSGVTILMQKSGNDVPLHTDSDDWLGMRFYLHNEIKEDILYFQRRKDRQNNRISTYLIDNTNVYPQKWENHLDLDIKIYSKHPAPRHAWTLTSVRAAHGLDKFHSDTWDRITFLVHSHRPPHVDNAWNTDKLYNLLTRSMQKYSEYAIWWKTFEES